MAHVTVVMNPKGGVGKSTIATNLAGYFANRGKPVMLGDVDKQQKWPSLFEQQNRIYKWKLCGLKSGTGRGLSTVLGCGQRAGRTPKA